MKTKIIIVFLFFSALVFLGVGCVNFNVGTSNIDGGVFRSVDRAANWVQKASLASVGGGKTIANLNIKLLVQDPSDSEAIYALAAEGGAYYTYDGGESWHRMEALGATAINAFLVDKIGRASCRERV